MRALTVRPGVAASARLDDVAEPDPAGGEVLVAARAVGVCGTDREILAGLYGQAPPGEERLILGHESLGRVLEAPAESGLEPGDHVCAIVRWPDPVPCPSCARGEWDMCENGRYTEHGIRGRHGFAAERWRLPGSRLVRLDPGLGENGVLLEPASVVAKAWAHLDVILRRSGWRPGRVLVTGAGPIGLLAALFARERGLEVAVLDRVTEGPKPRLVEDLGATYVVASADGLPEADIVLECTGAASLVVAAMRAVGPNGVVALTGVSSGGRTLAVDTGALNRELVLENNVVFGSVNANRTHYELAATALAAADPAWLARLLTRRVPIGLWAEAFERRDGDVKTLLTFD